MNWHRWTAKNLFQDYFHSFVVVNAFCSMNNFPLNSKMHSMLWQWHTTRQKTPHTRISFVHHIKSQRHQTHASNMYGTQSMSFIKPINSRNLKLSPKCDRCTKNYKEKPVFEIQSKIDFEPGVFSSHSSETIFGKLQNQRHFAANTHVWLPAFAFTVTDTLLHILLLVQSSHGKQRQVIPSIGKPSQSKRMHCHFNCVTQ